MNRLLGAGATMLAVLLASCGGGGGGGASIAPGTPQPTAGPLVPTQFAIVIPSQIPSASAKERSAQFVSPATTTVSISVNGGTAQTFAVSNGTPCGPGTTTVSGTCTVYNVNAPVGTDTFVVSLFDAQNRLLSQGTVQQTIVQNTTNTVNITFNGVVGAVRVSLANPSPPAGTPAKIQVFPLPVDADGYTLVGSPGTLPSMTVTDSDTSGATGLYLAGSDGTCNTQAAAPAASVAIAQTGARYPTVCLNYTGAPVATVTITASIAGGASGSAPFVPSQGQTTVSGMWVFGQDPIALVPVLERLDPSLHPVIAISGSQTKLRSTRAIVVDSAGNVDVLQDTAVTHQFEIDAYSGTTGGNVPPISTTTFLLPDAGQTPSVENLGLDTDGVAYVVGNPQGAGSSPNACTIYRVPLTGGTSTPTAAGDCSLPGYSGAYGLHVDAQRRVYFAYWSLTAPATAAVGQIYRFARNPDGTLAAEAALTVPTIPRGVDVTPAGDVYISFGDQSSNAQIERFAASSFVPGSKTSAAPTDIYTVMAGALGVDLQGNVFFTDVTHGTQPTTVGIVPAGGHTETNTIAFNAGPYARATTAVPSSGSALTAPNSVQLPAQNSITVTENGYTGPITQTNNCAGIATVQPASSTGPSSTFTVTQGQSGGTCSVIFGDAGPVHTATVTVGNTQVIVTGQGVRRRP